MDNTLVTDSLSAIDKRSRGDYGDWQTSFEFARSVCQYLKSRGLTPDIIIEPTCGVGNFIAAAIDIFDSVKKVYGVELAPEYIEQTEKRLKEYKNNKRIAEYSLYNTDVFSFDFQEIVKENPDKSILILGNPPWVTNSALGKTEGTNLPAKGNIHNTRGIEAITGKGNFDIAETICYALFDAFSKHRNTYIALLVKNTVIKNILHAQYAHPRPIQNLRQLCFDAKKEFKVAVAASLFECQIGEKPQTQCQVYDFYTRNYSHAFGWVKEAFVSNVQDYTQTDFLDGLSPLIWRSGIKHDCAKVMELSLEETIYFNGLKEIVDVDEQTLFPLLNSSDIGRGRKESRKYIVLPQTHISEDTAILKRTAPKTYAYLLEHAKYLDGRKSSIYRNKSRFCVFGLGDYSFAPYKVVISALYADIIFSLIEPVEGKPVMVDDTCYLLGFQNLEYAKLTLFILQSKLLKTFIRNISFADAKRVVSRELLMRINLYQLSKSVDYSSVDIAPDKILEYQNWLCSQTTSTLFN